MSAALKQHALTADMRMTLAGHAMLAGSLFGGWPFRSAGCFCEASHNSDIEGANYSASVQEGSHTQMRQHSLHQLAGS